MLCAQQWNEACNDANGLLHKGRTWHLLRHFLDETKNKRYQHNLARTLHKVFREYREDEVKRRLDTKYQPSTTTEPHPDYQSNENETLGRDIETWEVRVALQDLNSRSAAGPNRVTNKALKNLNDATIESLTAYYKCWGEGKLPSQWKAAKTILIPKPGKPPYIDSLRPISLTSCVGKVLEHVLMNRWQRYLEESELHPNSIIGFRNKLCTQESMIPLKNEVVDDTIGTKDNKAILGVDLHSAFDKSGTPPYWPRYPASTWESARTHISRASSWTAPPRSAQGTYN